MHTQKTYQWAVVGAGPAGIAAVGKLLDQGISPQAIIWIDPEFCVGDFGKRWANVSSNTTVQLFLDFLNACEAFDFEQCPHDFAISELDPMQTCELRYMVEPLQWITKQLSNKVVTIQNSIKQLNFHQGVWQLTGESTTQLAEQVILAIGAEPRALSYTGPIEVPLETALNKAELAKTCQEDDVVAVFGSSHSAIIILRHLLENKVKRVINFYHKPLAYALKMEQAYLFDNTGLKGETAVWARANLHGQLSESLQRVYADEANIAKYLPLCQKAIYAIGFERRAWPKLDDLPKLEYNPHNGIIAPGLFGLGIAFPEAKLDMYGDTEYGVGLWKFMDYLNRMLPLWLAYR